jgi:hypothetical protein
MIAGRLTMRAAIQRNYAPGSDAWGAPVEAVFIPIAAAPVACFVWSTSASQVEDGQKTAEIEAFRALFALGADVQPGDEIAAVTDRAGNVILPGRLRVEPPVQRKHTHLEATLRRIG